MCMVLLFDLMMLFICLICFYLLLLNNLKPKHRHSKAGFKSYPLVGTLPEFLLNRNRFLDWSTQVLSSCPTKTSVFRRPGNIRGVITANPENVEHMLKGNFDNYPKGVRFISLLHDFLGNGIFSSDGEQWKVQRKTASYEFNTKTLRNFVMENLRLEMGNRLIPLLERSCQSGRVLDLQDILQRFSFDNICRIAFNIDPDCLGGDGKSDAEFMQAFEAAAKLSADRFMSALPEFYKFKKYFSLGSERKLQKSIAQVHEFADKIIKSRIKERSGRGKEDEDDDDQDLLSRFMCSTSDGEINSLEYLRDIVISFILAGRDTTSSALTWFFWLLSSRPEIEKRILEELQIIRNRRSSGAEIFFYSFDELRQMHYLHAAISEAMRLYPPVPVDTKACLADDVLPDGTFIGKNWFISYHTYAMGRMDSIWGEDCCEFKPERWLQNDVCKQESPYKYPVFNGGPRICLGKDMAYIQMKSIAAGVLERFQVEVLLEAGKCPEHLLSLTLRMKDGLLVRVKERRLSHKHV